jgi:hypothetical protein
MSDPVRCTVRFQEWTNGSFVQRFMECHKALKHMERRTDQVSKVHVCINPDLKPYQMTDEYERCDREFKHLSPENFRGILKCALRHDRDLEFLACCELARLKEIRGTAKEPTP